MPNNHQTTLEQTSAVASLLRQHRPGAERLRVLSASGQLGFGIVQESFERGLQRQPHFIGCDMGSIDPGPFYLGSGQMAAPKDMVRRDLEMVLLGARQLNVPLIIGSAAKMAVSQALPAIKTSGFCARAFMNVCVPHCATMLAAE